MVLNAKSKSLRSNAATQVYSHKFGFTTVYHMDKANNENIGNSLGEFASEFLVLENLTFDGATVQLGSTTIFQNHVRKNDIQNQRSAPWRPNENPSEGSIWEVKRKWYQIQEKKNIPDRLWDYGIKHVCETANITVNISRYSDGRTFLEIITGETPDLSENLDFGFYDWVMSCNNAVLGVPEVV